MPRTAGARVAMTSNSGAPRNGDGQKGDVVWKETDGVVWKETHGVHMEDEEWEAKESFLSPERMG